MSHVIACESNGASTRSKETSSKKTNSKKAACDRASVIGMDECLS